MCRLKGILLLFILALTVFCVGTGHVSAQTAPDCPCDDIYDLTDPSQFADYDACYASQCDGADVPVDGNVWGLALAGLVLALVKAGVHRRVLYGVLRGYVRVRNAIG